MRAMLLQYAELGKEAVRHPAELLKPSRFAKLL